MRGIGRQAYHRKVWVRKIGVHGVRWVDKHNRVMLLQLFPEWTEVGVPEVMIVVTVTGIERYTVRFQRLQ